MKDSYKAIIAIIDEIENSEDWILRSFNHGPHRVTLWISKCPARSKPWIRHSKEI
jgi:hypothetical protein